MTEKPDSQENLERSIRPVSASFVVVGANRSALYAASWLKKAGASIVRLKALIYQLSFFGTLKLVSRELVLLLVRCQECLQ